MNEEQANELKGFIFAQLHEFDGWVTPPTRCSRPIDLLRATRNPPFTIQRICELCLHPKEHYKTVGKYLRAIEKSVLVTSTWDAFPVPDVKDIDASTRVAITLGGTQTTSATPLFSPIPFLHDDARRSKSHSPPPSPLVLGAVGPVTGGHPEAIEPKALGLVDELDDPSPGHMSDHPTALTSVTTLAGASSGARPFLGSLEQRFVKEGGEQGPDQGANGQGMVLDDADDKENKG